MPGGSGREAGSTIGSTFDGAADCARIVLRLCSDCAQIVRPQCPGGRNVRRLCCDCATSTAVILCCGLCFASSLVGGGRFLNFSIVFWFCAIRRLCRVLFFLEASVADNVRAHVGGNRKNQSKGCHTMRGGRGVSSNSRNVATAATTGMEASAATQNRQEQLLRQQQRR